MGYIAPSYDNIIIGDEVPPTYTAPVYDNIVIADTPGVGRYAIVIYQNHMITISDILVGTGLQPYVWDNGVAKTRSDSEGIPLVFRNGNVCTLPEEDFLII